MTDDAVNVTGDDAGHLPGAPSNAVVAYADNPGGVSIERLVAELPPAIAVLGEGARWQTIGVAPTGATVWRLERADGPATFLKVAPEVGGGAARLRAEGERLAWLSRMIPTPAESADRMVAGISVPSVVASVTDPVSGEHYLATSEVPGTPAGRSGLVADADGLIVALAHGLRAFHELPAGSCPFVTSIDDRLMQAAARVEQGLVDRRRFQPIHARYAPEQLYAHLLTMRPTGDEQKAAHDQVVVHGDPTLDNTLVAGGRVVGYVDVGTAGVSDRYLDLAVVARQLANRVSPHALGPFFAAYGIELPDVRRIDFYLLLDEFF